MTHHANISGAQKVDRKKERRERGRRREKITFHTRMQSKIKIPNSKTNRNVPKNSNPKHMEGEGGQKEREGEEQVNFVCFA